jgi:hypothetical protein
VAERIIDVELDEAAQVGLRALMAEGMTESEAVRTALIEAASTRDRRSRRRAAQLGTGPAAPRAAPGEGPRLADSG